MTELNMKQNDTASEVIASEEANNTTETKIDAVVNVEKVIDCFNGIHAFWRSCNEKLYEGLAELYGVVKDASDDDIEAICQKFNIKYEKQETIIHIDDRMNIIFMATFDSAFKDELGDERFKTRFCERRKIYKMAIKNMLGLGLTKEQALNELKDKGVEAIARGKSKEIKKTTSQAANQTDDECVSEIMCLFKLTQEQKAILDAVTDDNAPNKVKSDFVILRYNNDDVIGANRQGVIKKMWDYTEHSNTYKGVEPFVVIVSCDELGVGNPPSSNDATDENGADNDKE